MTLENVKDFLLEKDNMEIICHANPDGDTLGSGFALCFALRGIGKKVNVVCVDEIPKRFDYINKDYLNQEFKAETFITVDTADKNLLGSKKEEYPIIHLSIDHHLSNKLFAEKTYLKTDVSSNCENIFDILKYMEIPFDKKIANAIFTGVVTDTGYFRQENTTDSSFVVASELKKCGAETTMIADVNFNTVTPEYLVFKKLALDTMAYYFNNQVVIFTVTLDMIEKSGVKNEETGALVALTSQIENVKIGATIKQKTENLYKISLRTSDPYCADEICGKFCGGGHKRASGCAIEGSLEEVTNKLLKVIENHIKEF